LVSAIVRFFYFFSSIISSIVLRMTISFPGHPIFRSSEKLDLISGSNRDRPSFIFFLLSFNFFLFSLLSFIFASESLLRLPQIISWRGHAEYSNAIRVP